MVNVIRQINVRLTEDQCKRLEEVQGEYETWTHAVTRAVLAGIDALIARKSDSEG